MISKYVEYGSPEYYALNKNWHTWEIFYLKNGTKMAHMVWSPR